MMKHFFLIPLLICLLLSSCSTPESFKNFDSETWKNDRYACDNKRMQLVEDFEKIKQDLIGKKEYVIRNVLGKPDNEELLEGNQRNYYYYLEPGSQCTERNKMSEANRVGVRINAIGKASEIFYKDPIQKIKPE
ncbi:hypothetical protein [Pontibacter silvestris]|nr:hypothetical protein [Pontibacter silvestris]MCC9137991.1 hypothetical protein [Pontibacter silvestris]